MSVFTFHFHVLSENEWKNKKYINFSWQFILFSQNCINFPVSSVFGELTSYLRKTIVILVQKKGIYAISRKKFLFIEKVNFLMIFCFFHCFHQTINKNHWILLQYTYFLKKILNNVVFNDFRIINCILNKTPFYKYNICNLKKEENSA